MANDTLRKKITKERQIKNSFFFHNNEHTREVFHDVCANWIDRQSIQINEMKKKMNRKKSRTTTPIIDLFVVLVIRDVDGKRDGQQQLLLYCNQNPLETLRKYKWMNEKSLWSIFCEWEAGKSWGAFKSRLNVAFFLQKKEKRKCSHHSCNK